MANGDGAPKKRRLRNYLVRPRQQVRIMFVVLSFGILSITFVTGYFMYYNVTLVAEMRQREPIAAVLLGNFISPMFQKIIAGQILLWVISVVVGLVITHRIYGPLVPILRHIRRLNSGDYASRVHLRGKDEMGELAEALNELAATLEKKRS